MKIIVNADDFGLSGKINESTIYCYKNGCLTSATLLAWGKAFDNAVKMAKENPDLGIGAHLVLDGQFDIPYFHSTVTNPETNSLFEKKDIIGKIKNRKIKHEDLVKIYSMQIEKILDNNINISHIDHHHHFHLYFQVLNALIDIAKKYKLKYIRSQNILLHINRSITNNIYRQFHQFYLKRKLNTTDGYFEIAPDNLDTVIKRLVRLLKMKKHIVEIESHPDNLDNLDSRFLLNNRVNELLNQHYLINYNNLA
jgi:predicted glycoside hydrolase/deacetylase ChbG (UPF0249 family)